MTQKIFLEFLKYIYRKSIKTGKRKKSIKQSETLCNFLYYYITHPFSYDKRRYRDEEDFDDRSMENNKFSSIMMEEARSARIGRQEDLEDIRREEAEKKRKRRR